MKVAISQPTYLPWMGYFDIMDQVETFVFLDSVQFEKQSWQQRNRIKTPTGLQWLTVPVVFRGRLDQRIKDVEIREPDFYRNHLRAIELNYRRAPFFERYFPELSSRLACPPGTLLADLNILLIEWFTRILGIGTPLVRASTLSQDGKRTQLLANICRSLGATQYFSPSGSAVYLLQEMNALTENGVEVQFHNYKHPEYRQLFPPFLESASVLDLIFNEGERSLEILRSGRGTPFLPEQVARSIKEQAQAR